MTAAARWRPDGADAVLPREWFARTAVDLAPDLLGRVLVHGGVAIRLTEVEAYEGRQDPGSHAYRGPTSRNRVMFGQPGHLYVYLSYGIHCCANLVCGTEGRASAVLLRAGEVLWGEELVRARRERSGRRWQHHELVRGPGRLGQALGLQLADNGTDLCVPGGGSWLAAGAPPVREAVTSGPRVGVSGPGGDAGRYPWRFWVAGEPSVSVYRSGGKAARVSPPRGDEAR